jgi:hypothetical protein
MPRKAWANDSTFSIEQPAHISFKQVLLTEDYFNSFRNVDVKRFVALHSLNRREELLVVSNGEK